jgi:hypothetical protein
MYPGMMSWWMRGRWHADYHPSAGCGTGTWSRWDDTARGRWDDRHASPGEGEISAAARSAFAGRCASSPSSSGSTNGR